MSLLQESRVLCVFGVGTLCFWASKIFFVNRSSFADLVFLAVFVAFNVRYLLFLIVVATSAFERGRTGLLN